MATSQTISYQYTHKKTAFFQHEITSRYILLPARPAFELYQQQRVLGKMLDLIPAQRPQPVFCSFSPYRVRNSCPISFCLFSQSEMDLGLGAGTNLYYCIWRRFSRHWYQRQNSDAKNPSLEALTSAINRNHPKRLTRPTSSSK